MTAEDLSRSSFLTLFLLPPVTMLLVNTRLVRCGTEDCLQKVPWLAPVPESQEEQVCIASDNPEMEEGEVQHVPLPRGDGDRRAGFEGSFFP